MTDYKNFNIETDADGVALVTWDMPGKSMNVFDRRGDATSSTPIVDADGRRCRHQGRGLHLGQVDLLRRRRPHDDQVACSAFAGGREGTRSAAQAVEKLFDHCRRA